jgi:hypothetical protein
VPGLGKIASIPFVTQLLQGVMPSLVLKIFLAILPMILNAMNRFAGAPSVSQIDFATVSKFFIFQVRMCALRGALSGVWRARRQHYTLLTYPPTTTTNNNNPSSHNTTTSNKKNTHTHAHRAVCRAVPLLVHHRLRAQPAVGDARKPRAHHHAAGRRRGAAGQLFHHLPAARGALGGWRAGGWRASGGLFCRGCCISYFRLASPTHTPSAQHTHPLKNTAPPQKKACAAGFGLLRPVPLILYLIKDKFAGTEKAKCVLVVVARALAALLLLLHICLLCS